ncbi:MAG TPA: TolC family protein [Kiritimatiellia bacterium]|nr:TolC family protein [Kiritimatiellia bacterium]
MNGMTHGFRRTGAAMAAVALLAGCVTVPDARQMREIRAEAAGRRVENLARPETTESGVYLSGPLLLWEAVALAQGNNRSLEQEREGREIARGRIQASWSEALPSLDLTGGYVRLDEERTSTLPDGSSYTTRHADQTSAGLRLTQPLFNGRIGAALRAAKLYDEWTEAAIRAATESVQRDTIRAYYRAVLSGHLLEVNRTALETAERQLADARARRRQGMASNYDELRAQVEVSNFRAQVLQARNERDVAYTALYRLMGASPESEADLVDDIPLVIEEIPFSDAVRTALERRADLTVAEYALRLQDESVASAKSRYLPEVSGYVTQTWANPDPHDSSRDEWGDEWQAGVQISLPVFDGLDRRGTLIQERAKRRQLEIALRDAEEQAVSEIRQAVLSLKTAEEFAHSQSRNLETAREALRLVEAGLKEGQNTPVEVMDARQALTKASANYYQSIFDHAMARVALQQAMGLLAPDALPDGPVLGESDVADGSAGSDRSVE